MLKKGGQKGEIYELTLKKEEGKWFFAINQDTWWVESIAQIIFKLEGLVHLNDFR